MFMKDMFVCLNVRHTRTQLYRSWTDEQSAARLSYWCVTCYRPIQSTCTYLMRVYELFGCVPQWKLGTKIRNRWWWVLVAFRTSRTVRDADVEKSGRGGLWVGWRRCERDEKHRLHVHWSCGWLQLSSVCFRSKPQHLPLTGRFPLSRTVLLLVLIAWINGQLRKQKRTN
jgi:hypothetical protein